MSPLLCDYLLKRPARKWREGRVVKYLPERLQRCRKPATVRTTYHGLREHSVVRHYCPAHAAGEPAHLLVSLSVSSQPIGDGAS